MVQQRTTAVIAALLLLLVAPGLSSDESPQHHQRRRLGFASSFSFTNLMYKLHFCVHPGPICGPPKCGPGPHHPPHLCDYYACSSDDCSFAASVEDCGDDSSCVASFYYYQDEGSSSSSGSSSSGGYDSSGSSSSGSDVYDNSNNYNGDGSSGRGGVSNGGSTYEIQNAKSAFSPMPYVIGGFALVGVLAFIVMRKRNPTGNKELTEALGPHDEELNEGIVAQRLQSVKSGVVQPASLFEEGNSTSFIEISDGAEETLEHSS